MLPGKKALIASVIGAAVLLFAYNKVPAIRKILGGS